MSDEKVSRRDLLKIAGVTAATIAGFQTIRKVNASEQAPSGGRQWAMVIDQSK